MEEIKPQKGPQEDFLSSEADIAIYGGAAGGGKTYALLLESLRNISNPKFSCLIFRRTTKQITKPGALWDESFEIFPYIEGSNPLQHNLTWNFSTGSKVVMAHMEHEKNRFDYQGSQIPLICFDELTHFTYDQFFYMLSRNRSMTGIKGYIRATCNPDPDSWVADFISWWIDQETGLPILERSGLIRWFIRIKGDIFWGNSKKELVEKYGDVQPKSVTFIPSKIEDNKILLEKDKEYLANLHALPEVDRQRLLYGNWKVRPHQGMYFKKSFFDIIEQNELPNDLRKIRYWDRAATEEKEGTDPDYTVGLLMSTDDKGTYYIEHIERFRASAGKVEEAIRQCANIDGKKVTIGIEVDPGSAGKFEAQYYVKALAGYHVWLNKVTKDKETRAKPLASQSEYGNVKVVRGDWNHNFFNELQAFPFAGHDDQVDGASGAFSFFTTGTQLGRMRADKKIKKTIMPSHKDRSQLW